MLGMIPRNCVEVKFIYLYDMFMKERSSYKLERILSVSYFVSKIKRGKIHYFL